MNTLQAIARQKLRDTRPCTCHPDDNPPVPCAEKYALSDCVGYNWLETFRQHFPDEFSEPEDEQARSSIERGNGQRTMAQRPGRGA